MCAAMLPSNLATSGVVRRAHRRPPHSKFGGDAGGSGSDDGGDSGGGGKRSSHGGCFPRSRTRRFLRSRMYSNDTATPWQWRWHGVLWRVCSQCGQDGVLFEIFRHIKV